MSIIQFQNLVKHRYQIDTNTVIPLTSQITDYLNLHENGQIYNLHEITYFIEIFSFKWNFYLSLW